MLWAFSTADRADTDFFEILTERLVSSMEQQQVQSKQGTKLSKNSRMIPSDGITIKPQV